MIRRYGIWTATAMALGLIVLLTGVGFGLQGSFKPKTCPVGPTGVKTQSKLWFNDESWWGVLFDGSSEEFRIFRFDEERGTWSDTGTLVDERNNSRADVLWDGPHLYVVSAGTEMDLDRDDARFQRYTYDPSTESYTLDEGFPVSISEGGMEAISIARDTTGRLWATFTQGPDLREVYVTHSSEGDDSRWVEPFVPPVPGTTVDSDDVASITAFGERVGIMWGNQYDEAGLSGYHFAYHENDDPDDAWRSEYPVRGPGTANDHVNIKADSQGRIYATTKTRRDRIDRDLDAPYGVLWVRDTDGSWTSHVYSRVRDLYTRSLLLIDEERGRLFVFGTSPTCSGGSIYYKTADIDDVSFESGRGEVFMRGADGAKIGDATSTKQNLEGDMDATVVASNPAGDHYFNQLDPADGQKLTPDGDRITSAGW